MSQTDLNTEQSSAQTFAPTTLIEMGKQRFEATLEVQTELLKNWQEMNREWLAHAQSELDLASELMGKLAAARSLPDTTTACQEWASKRMSLLTDDGRRLVAGAQKFAETGARLLSNGRAGGSA
jgi:hypothetical protein